MGNYLFTCKRKKQGRHAPFTSTLGQAWSPFTPPPHQEGKGGREAQETQNGKNKNKDLEANGRQAGGTENQNEQ